jgi:outer membrane protein OmpA-like peptidoglycan-associated protein
LKYFTAWAAQQGRLGTVVKARVSGDALQVTSQTQLGRLQLFRVAPGDEAERRVGLPLGMIVALLKDREGNISLSLPVGGRLSDPRFDFHDAIWSALRKLTVHAIALPVSWIGRLRMTPDSKIADIEIDPVEFGSGSTELAGRGEERVTALASFMKKLPAVRIVVTPAVSLGDVEVLKAEQVRTRIREVATQQRLTERGAAERLYAQHYRGREAPDDIEAIVAALQELEPPPADAAYRLAKRRADIVRDALKKAEIDPERLSQNKEPEALDSLDGGRLDFSLTDRVKPRRTLADLLRALAQALAQRLTALTR